MTNKEKYPNTEDALKAFAEHNKHCDCGATFEEWLKMDATPSGIGKSIAGVILGSLMLGRLVDGVRRAAEDETSGKPKKSDDEPSSDDKLTGIECPICHGKNGEILTNFLGSTFECADCGIIMDKSRRLTHSVLLSPSEAKSFIAGLCKKNVKNA